MDKHRLLVLGAGRRWTNYIGNPSDITCVDHMYQKHKDRKSGVCLIRDNIFNYLECYDGIPFDGIIADRVFEHIDYEQIPYLLYLCYECTYKGSLLKLTVPNFEMVTDTMNSLNPTGRSAPAFNRDMIEVHTELFNTREDPHRSVWTKQLAEYYIQLEEFWKLVKIETPFSIDNRDWYMFVEATRN